MKKIISYLILFGLIVAGIHAADAKMPGLPVGEKAPGFSAVSYTGQNVNLSTLLRNGPVVLLFYRGGWCPYCNRQLQDYQVHIAEFKALGYQLVGVSVDQQSQAAKTVGDQKLDFIILSNPDAKILDAYNVRFMVPESLVEKYRNEHKIDLTAYSGREDGVIAYPALYIIDATGTITHAEVYEDYKVRTKAEDVLSMLNPGRKPMRAVYPKPQARDVTEEEPAERMNTKATDMEKETKSMYPVKKYPYSSDSR